MSILLRIRRWSGLVLFLLAAAPVLAQSTAGYGDWQLYLPNSRARALADAGNRVYVASEDAFFFYDKELNTTQMLSRRDGLHDVGVSTLGYDPATRQTLVAYRNGNLDVLREDGSIVNVTDIFRKQISGSKTINQIYFNSRLAYLSCDFGLVVLDMAKLEVRANYLNIGPNGQAVQVYATTILNGTLFAATSYGVMRGLLANNLLDYHNWTTDLLAGLKTYRTLATQNGRVYAGVTDSFLLCYNCGSTPWQPVGSILAARFLQLTPSATGLLVVENGKVVLLKDDNTVVTIGTVAQLPIPQAVLQDKAGNFYVADYQNGLLKSTNGQQFEQFMANAPAGARAQSVLADSRSNTVDIFSGGYTDRYVQNEYLGGFYEYADGRWTNFTAANYPNPQEYPNLKDLTRGVRTPDGTLYIGTYGDGVLQWKGPGKFRQFTQGTPGVTLHSAIPSNPAFTRITDLTTDAAGNVWIVNRHPERPGVSGLHVYNPRADTWRNVPYFAGFDNLDRIVIDDNGYVWVTESRKDGAGVICYDDKGKVVRYFTDTNGGLPSNQIYDIVKDRKGDVWVATLNGIAVFADPSQVFAVPNSGFTTPVVRRGISSGYVALRDEVVHAVAVDGGNRKWFGTERGLWLFSEDAEEGLLHFTTDNSPLPSNNIVDVEVNDRTGEVFVVTDAGVVAYRGDATITPEGEISCAKVSPNPVRTDFMGEVGISGLANNGFVKITDVTGKLVYQTRANGGTITWTLTDYNGRKVQSGVYLVLSSDANGKNGCVSKIAVVAR